MTRMIKRIRMRALWMAIGLVLGGGALAFAGAAVQSEDASDHGKTVSETAKGDPSAVSEVASSTGAANKAGASAKDKKNEDREAGAQGGGGERKRNHGFYVSSAAHCEDVEDPEHDLSFTAPENCETDGDAHGEYVSTVAKSDAGKKAESGEEGTEGTESED